VRGQSVNSLTKNKMPLTNANTPIELDKSCSKSVRVGSSATICPKTNVPAKKTSTGIARRGTSFRGITGSGVKRDQLPFGSSNADDHYASRYP
jgi:hypothetical protein